MVLRDTGAGWLASMMRAERQPDGEPEPERLEALEQWMLPPRCGGAVIPGTDQRSARG